MYLWSFAVITIVEPLLPVELEVEPVSGELLLGGGHHRLEGVLQQVVAPNVQSRAEISHKDIICYEAINCKILSTYLDITGDSLELGRPLSVSLGLELAVEAPQLGVKVPLVGRGGPGIGTRKTCRNVAYVL